MVCHPATRRERNEREKSVPNKSYPVEISTEVMMKHGTHISPHKPILCWDLCGRGACFAVTVPMDHPSRGGHFPSQVRSVHRDTVPYGWGNRQGGSPKRAPPIRHNPGGGASPWHRILRCLPGPTRNEELGIAIRSVALGIKESRCCILAGAQVQALLAGEGYWRRSR